MLPVCYIEVADLFRADVCKNVLDTVGVVVLKYDFGRDEATDPEMKEKNARRQVCVARQSDLQRGRQIRRLRSGVPTARCAAMRQKKGTALTLCDGNLYNVVNEHHCRSLLFWLQSEPRWFYEQSLPSLRARSVGATGKSCA